MINMLRDNVPFSFLNTDGGHVRRKFDILSDIYIRNIPVGISAHKSIQ